jgi:hypothetical protein
MGFVFRRRRPEQNGMFYDFAEVAAWWAFHLGCVANYRVTVFYFISKTQLTGFSEQQARLRNPEIAVSATHPSKPCPTTFVHGSYVNWVRTTASFSRQKEAEAGVREIPGALIPNIHLLPLALLAGFVTLTQRVRLNRNFYDYRLRDVDLKGDLRQLGAFSVPEFVTRQILAI